MNICIDDRIISQDHTDIGRIKGIIYDPRLGEVTHLVVHKGLFFAHDTLIPMSMVQGNEKDGLILHVSSDEIGELPKYLEGMLRTGPAGSEEVAETPDGKRFGVQEPPDRAEGLRKAIHLEPGSVEITKNTEVAALDGTLGNLGCMQVDQYSNHLAYVVVGKPKQGRNEISVPFEWVFKVEGHKVSLSVPRKQALQGPPPPAGPYIPVEPREEELHQ